MTTICFHHKILSIFIFLFLDFTTLIAEIPKQKSYLENESEEVTPTEELVTEPETFTFFDASNGTSRDENYSESTITEVFTEPTSDNLTELVDSNTTAVAFNENGTEIVTTSVQPTESTTVAEEKIDENVLSFAFHGEDICMCDLTSVSCDVNCCCDNDCSQEDRQVFSQCIPHFMLVDSPYCFHTNIIYKNNTPYKITKNAAGDLFCIVEDNFKERFSYRNIPSFHNVEDFEELYGSEVFTWNYEDSKSPESYALMKAGNSLYVTAAVSNEIRTTQWRIPSQCFSELCECGKQVTYMIDQQSSCSHLLHELEVQCEKNTALAAKSYENFCVANYPSEKRVNESVVPIVEYFDSSDRNESKSEDDDIKSLVCITSSVIPPKPLFNRINSMCENVVTHIHYTVIHSGIRGIETVSVSFKFGNISKNSPSLVQHFSVDFKWTNASSNATVRSGNPGYLNGYPILAGERVNTTDASKKISTVIKLHQPGLTVSKSSGSGFCDGERQTVVFGQNVKSGCFMKVAASDSCKSLQDHVFKILLGSGSRPTYVGIFGNSEIMNSGDWIEILHERITAAETIVSAQSTSLCNVILSIRIDIAYAAVGSLANPQFKIVGVVYRYDSVQPVNLACGIDSCVDIYNDISDDSVLELSTTLSFLDVSEPAVPAYTRLPVLEAKLPHDFFYPFLLSAGEKSFSCHIYILLPCMLVLCITLYF